MNDDNHRAHLLEYITEQISRVTPLLQYVGGRTYKDLCDIAERHIIGKDTVRVFLVELVPFLIVEFQAEAFGSCF